MRYEMHKNNIYSSRHIELDREHSVHVQEAQLAPVGGHFAFDTAANRKPVCDFLLVNNNNLHPILHRFQVIADYWSNLRFRQRVHLFNKLVWGESLQTEP